MLEDVLGALAGTDRTEAEVTESLAALRAALDAVRTGPAGAA